MFVRIARMCVLVSGSDARSSMLAEVTEFSGCSATQAHNALARASSVPAAIEWILQNPGALTCPAISCKHVASARQWLCTHICLVPLFKARHYRLIANGLCGAELSLKPLPGPMLKKSRSEVSSHSHRLRGDSFVLETPPTSFPWPRR